MLQLVIGNKNYSSWSLRPWLALRHFGIDFSELRIPLYTETSAQLLKEYSPAGKVPVLLDGDLESEIVVWDSLAILEYVGERFPELPWLPQEPVARGVARSICAEMHSGFLALRSTMPMNLRSHKPMTTIPPEVQRDIDRVIEIWRDCREQFGAGGDFLFGEFTIADAMYAPVVSRFRTYGVSLDPICQAYADAVWQMPAMQAWIEAAIAETETIPMYE